MASPDLQNYFGLTFFDINPQDVYEAGAAQLGRSLPELVLREGHIETLLLEAIAQEVAESVYALNRLPDGIFEVLLKMFGINRDIGTNPVVNLSFEVNRTDGCTIPSGTSAVVAKPNDLGNITFVTTEDLHIPAGETSGFVPAIGNQLTDSANGIPANTNADLLDSISYVDWVKTASEIVGGRDPEADENYLSRGVQRLSRLSSTLVLPQHFSAAALEQVYVTRAHALDNYDPDNDLDGNGPVGADAGAVTVAVWGNNEHVSPAQRDELKALMQAQALVNLKVSVIPANLATFDTSATIRIEEGQVHGEVLQAIEDELRLRYSLETVEWDEVIRKNDLITIINQTPGVAFVRELTTPVADISPAKIATLTSLGTATITIEN